MQPDNQTPVAQDPMGQPAAPVGDQTPVVTPDDNNGGTTEPVVPAEGGQEPADAPVGESVPTEPAA